MKKIDKRVWWSLPILLGGYLIYRQFAKSKQPILEPIEQVDPLIKSTPSPSPSPSSSYPLKKGSRDWFSTKTKWISCRNSTIN